MNFNLKLYKLCDEYELGKTWRKESSSSNSFVALEDKSIVVLGLENSSINDTVYFKKGAIVSFNNGLLEYYENDLL